MGWLLAGPLFWLLHSQQQRGYETRIFSCSIHLLSRDDISLRRCRSILTCHYRSSVDCSLSKHSPKPIKAVRLFAVDMLAVFWIETFNGMFVKLALKFPCLLLPWHVIAGQGYYEMTKKVVLPVRALVIVFERSGNILLHMHRLMT